jgi:DNA-binding CsgD family transcriptional regulator
MSPASTRRPAARRVVGSATAGDTPGALDMSVTSATKRQQPGSLSVRECEVLEQIARGQSIEDIAGNLFLSPHTVRTHIKNILRKMGARTRAHAVAMAISEELIDRRRVAR